MGRSWGYKLFAVIAGLSVGFVPGGTKYLINAGGGWDYRDATVAIPVGAIAFVLFTRALLSFEKRR